METLVQLIYLKSIGIKLSEWRKFREWIEA